MASSTATTNGRIVQAALASLQAGALTMADVAARAGLSRQAVYLHFADRGALLAALAAGLDPDGADRLAAITAAPSARAGLSALVAWQGAQYPLAAALAEAGATESGAGRLACCRAVAQRFRDEGRLAAHLSADAAADLLWSLTGLGVWRDLAARGWDAVRYRDHLTFLAVSALTK